jgi:DNA repair exonuclease SbcCD ATPase subunit
VIEFQKLRWKNFLATGNAFAEIDFQQTCTTLMVGRNGTGKSTFMDALCYVLFKKPYREINLPQLVNSKNGKDCVVELMFKVGSTHYLVRRGMKPAVFDIYCDGKLLNQPGNTKDYQETLERHILKLNYKSFSQIVILGPAKFKPFMKLAAADRRAVIDDVLDIEVFTVMSTIAKQRLQASKRRLGEIDLKADGLVYAKQALQENLAKYKTQADIDTAKLEAEKVTTAEAIVHLMKKLKPHKAEIEKQLEFIAATGKTYDWDRDRARRAIIEAEQKIKQFKEQVKFLRTTVECPTCEQSLAESVRMSKLISYSMEISLANNARLEAEQQLKEAQKFIDEVVAAEQFVRAANIETIEWIGAIKSFKQHIEHLDSRLAQAKQQDDLIADTETHIARIDGELKELETEYLSLQDAESYQTAAVALLKDSGMKARLLRDYLPVINTQVNKYLQALDFYVGFTLDENFNETIKSRFRDEFSYGNFSMGQQMRIDLAMLFTWRDVARMRNSVSTNLLIMDEIFDSSLDGDGTDDFLKIMETVSKDTQIFVISHKTEQLLEKFDRVIRFELKKDFTVMMA